MDNKMITRYGVFVVHALWYCECIFIFIISLINQNFTIRSSIMIAVFTVIGKLILSGICSYDYDNHALFCYMYSILSTAAAIYFSVKLESSMLLLLVLFFQWFTLLFFFNTKIGTGLLIIQSLSLFILLSWKVFIINSDYNMNVREMMFIIGGMFFCNCIVKGFLRILIQQYERSTQQSQSLDDMLGIVESICDKEKQMASGKAEVITDLSNSINRLTKTIHSMNELIQKETDIKKIRDYSSIISETEQYIYVMTEEIKTYMKLEENEIVIQDARYDFGDVLREILTDTYHKAAEKNLSFVISVSEDLERSYIGDRQLVEKVIRILITDAIQYTDRGMIDVEIYKGNVEQGQNRHQICIDVRDTGHGIKRKDAANIFAPFYRVEEYNARNSHNAGLGLYIATRFVSLMDGSLSVESEYGKGSVFHLKFMQTRKLSLENPKDSLFDYLTDIIEELKVSPEKKIEIVQKEPVVQNDTEDTIEEASEKIDLPEIAGIDWKIAMEYLSNKETILLTLNEFQKSGYENAKQLRHHYVGILAEDGEAMSLFEIKVHAVKSNLRMIGATEMSDRAKELEFAAKKSDKEYIAAKTGEFLDDYTDLIIAVGKIPEIVSNNQGSHKLFEKEKVVDMLEKIMQAMDSFDMETADETMKKLEAYDYPDNLLRYIERLSGMVLNLDNDGARECIENIKEQLG